MIEPSIKYIDYYIPEEELSIDNFIDIIDVNSIPKVFKNKKEYLLFIEDILSLKTIRIENTLEPSSMIGKLIEKLFNKGIIKPEEIDIIILAQEPGLNGQKNLAQFLQNKYEMDNSYVFNVSGNNCVNIEIAVDIAFNLIKNNDNMHNILIISSTKTNNINDRIIGAYGIFGDGAGIMLISDINSGIKLIDKVILCNSELYEMNFNVDNSIVHCQFYFKCITELLKKKNLTDDNIKTIIIQNANPMLVTQCISSAGLKQDKIFRNNLGKYGHLNQLDFLVNLKDVWEDESLNKTGYILSFGSGWAGTYVATIIQ